MKLNVREWIFQIWYWYVNYVDKNAEVLFMNYGYSDPGQKVELEPHDEPNRFSVQLYHLLANSIDLTNKKIIEIGCGRGGGLSYIMRKFNPSAATGVDLDSRAVNFNNKHYKIDGLSFQQADAQNLPMEDNSFDVLFNVESSHRYPDISSFFKEVRRILKPQGYFLYTDFRYDYEMPEFEQLLKMSGLNIIKEELITPQVVEALNCDDGRRRKLIEKLSPRILHDIALNFAGTVGSETYNQFAERKYVYFFYVLQKN
jgi:ubiquinone/menaquinone biosynthesis C-methylase UbiE